MLWENWAALHYAPVRSNQIKESWIQWTPRHLALHNVCRNHFSSKLFLHCLHADTNFWFHCWAKDWLKFCKGRSKWDVAEHYIYYNKAGKRKGNDLSEPSVSSNLPARSSGEADGRQIKRGLWLSFAFFPPIVSTISATILLSGQPGMNLLS